MVDSIFLQISIILGLTAGLGVLVRLLRQPLLIAYIVAGIFSGPLLLNFIHGKEESYEIFSQFGIVLLLFVVGLSLNFQHIKKIGKVALITGFGQTALTALLSFFLLQYIGASTITALYLSIALTFSSTIIITKLLSDKKDTESVYGRYTIGLMLVQDVIAILIMVVLVSAKDTQVSLLASLGFLALKGGVLIACVYFLSKFFIPLVLDRIAGSAEFLFLFTVAWCFGVTSLVYLMGLSLEIGAIVAGLSLGSSPYQPEISSRVRPLRDFFLILFFILLGSEMNVGNFASALAPAFVLSLFILLIKPLVLYFLFRVFKFTRRNSFLSGTIAAQVSEFGFILLVVGQQLGHVSENELAIFTLVALITIFFSSYIITYNEGLYRLLIPFFSLFGKDKYQQTEETVPEYEAWVVGYHRMGWKVCEALKEKRISFAVIDYNPETVKHLQQKNIPVYFGDVADVEFLSTLPLQKAQLVVSTIPEADDQFTFIKYIRSLSKKPYIIANLVHSTYLNDFYQAGADYIMMPHFLGGYRIAEILKDKKLSRATFRQLRTDQEKEMRLRLHAKAHG